MRARTAGSGARACSLRPRASSSAAAALSRSSCRLAVAAFTRSPNAASSFSLSSSRALKRCGLRECFKATAARAQPHTCSDTASTPRDSSRRSAASSFVCAELNRASASSACSPSCVVAARVFSAAARFAPSSSSWYIALSTSISARISSSANDRRCCSLCALSSTAVLEESASSSFAFSLKRASLLDFSCSATLASSCTPRHFHSPLSRARHSALPTAVASSHSFFSSG